jgi:hypothetical protein
LGKKIVVRQVILSAAQRLETLSESGNEADPLELAELKIEDCQAAGDSAGIKFWRAVWIHLMLTRYAPGEIMVIQDDEHVLP